ncbi:hypothetical protein AK830_g7143 [Neonectria ditissima]|uniref:Zn(2)-C6 fungal-type domain-containing protein n=1 Tax=Neonectria ditissima TaxID=78410 RepID=A0A0P7BEQ8_9HYPO|nr:hypothetical protein AK830_g7143 [Neonectria ditissima]
MSKNIKTIPTSEYDAVIKVVQEYYVDGLRVGSTDTVAKSFHRDATMYGLTLDNVLLGGPVKNLYTYMEEHGSAPDIKTRLDVVGITPTTAVVKVDMEKDAAGFDYTDFHTMIKLDGKWQIVAKVFHTKKKCDQILPSCGQCTRSGAECVRFAQRKARPAASVPWDYVHGLETRIERLERSLAECVAELKMSRRLADKPCSPHTPSLSPTGNGDLMQQDSENGVESREECPTAASSGHVSPESNSQAETAYIGPCTDSADGEAGLDLVTPSNLEGYLKYVHPIWAFLDEDLLTLRPDDVAKMDAPQSPQSSHRRFFVELACAIGCFYSTASAPSQRVVAYSQKLHDHALENHLQDAVGHSTTRQLQACILVIIHAIHSPAPYRVRNATDEALAKLAEILSTCRRLIENGSPSSLEDGEGAWSLDTDDQREKRLRTVIVYAYSAYELMAIAWDRPYQEFTEPLNNKIWNQYFRSTFDGAPQDALFEHQFYIRRIQTRVRRFWNEMHTLSVDEQRLQRTEIKADMDQWRALIPFTSSNIETSTNYHPLSMLKLYDYTICNLYQQGDHFPTGDDCLLLLSAASENCRCFRRIQIHRPMSYYTWTGANNLQALEDCEFTLRRFSQRWEEAGIYYRLFRLLLSQTPLSFPDNSSFNFPDAMADEVRDMLGVLDEHGLSMNVVALISRIAFRTALNSVSENLSEPVWHNRALTMP